MTPILTKQQIEALLGRSLSEVENTNFTTYLNIAQARLEDLLCTTLTNPLEPAMQLLLARCFGVITLEQQATADTNVTSKKVEDFSVTYGDKDGSPMEAFVRQNANELEHYSECQARVRQGKVCNYDGIRPIWLR